MLTSKQPKNFVREIRELRRLKQEDLASRIGVSVATISNIETGRRGMSIMDLLDIAKELNCRISDILGETNIHDTDKTLCRITEYNNENTITVSKNILDNHNLSLETLIFIKANDVSMYPIIKTGDIIIIDTSQKDLINEDAKFACIFNNRVLVRNFKYNPVSKAFKMSAINPEYDDTELHRISEDQINDVGTILGKVCIVIGY